MLHFTFHRILVSRDFILQQVICSSLPSPTRVKPQHVQSLELNPIDVKLWKSGVDKANNKPKLENRSAREASWTQYFQCGDLTTTTRDFVLICPSEHTHAQTWTQLHCRLVSLLKNGLQSKKQLFIPIFLLIIDIMSNITWIQNNYTIAPRWYYRHIYLWAPFLY